MGWSCWPSCQLAQSLSRCSSWLGAASAGLSPQQPAGHLGAGAQLWANPLAPTLLPPALSFPCCFPLVFFHEPSISGLPSTPIQLLLCILSAGNHPHSLPVLTAHCQHQGHPTPGSPHVGAELSWGQTRAMTIKDSTSTGSQPSHSGTPGDPGWPVWVWQQCCCSREAAAGSRWALSLCNTGRYGAGPSPPSWWAVCSPPSCYHPHPTLADTALCSGLGAGVTGLQHGCFHSWHPDVGPGLNPSPAQWGPLWDHPSQPERGQIPAAPQQVPILEGAGTRAALMIPLPPQASAQSPCVTPMPTAVT